jgi:CheY-like chemotaxis protein
MTLAGPTILVVEDEPLIRLSATEALDALGFVVLEAGNAEEAIAVLEIVTDVSVVFTDVQMPGAMDGVALAAVIRQRWPNMAIVVTSGQVRPAEVEVPAGTDFLTKPYLIDELIAKLGGGCGYGSEGADHHPA